MLVGLRSKTSLDVIRINWVLLTLLSLTLPGAAAEKSLQLKDLPAAVQKTVTEQAKGAEIKNISREKENGVSQYEVETMLNEIGRAHV